MSRWTHTDNDGTRTVFEADEGEVEAMLARQEAEDNEGEEDEVAFKKAIRIANSITARDPHAVEQHAAAIAVAEAALASIQRRKRLARREREERERNERVQRQAQAQRERERREQEQREVEARRAQRAAPPIAVERTTVPTKSTRREPEPVAARSSNETSSDAEERSAAARLTNAQAAKIEAEAALLRAQAKAAMESRPTAPATSTAPQRPPRARRSATSPPRGPLPRAAHGSSSGAGNDSAGGYNEADRLALASVGHWPPTPIEHRSAFWGEYDDWPRDWTLTGGDLGRFRGEVNLTRAVFAAQLGVPSAVVKDAELSPGERVGPALQIALRKAMDHAAEERRRRREERAAAAARAEPVLAPAAVTLEAPSTELAPAARVAGDAMFTGADLARLRGERRLSQREMADLLGVEQGTISKGEGKAGAAVGPALQEAMARLGAGGRAGDAGDAPAIPE